MIRGQAFLALACSALVGAALLAMPTWGQAQPGAKSPAKKPAANERAPNGRAGPAPGTAETPKGPVAQPHAATLVHAAQKDAHAKGTSARCEACHTEDGWLPAQFVHERTGFPLRGRHVDTPCYACHRGDFTASQSTQCSACHRDVHTASFGLQCAGCHNERTWRTTMDATAHLSTNFPLTGRHGALLCTECHGDRRDRGFRQPVNDCASCHLSQYDATALVTMDHQRSRLSTDCRSCHQPTRFRPATLPTHVRCYPLVGTAHNRVSCLECHQTLAGTVADGTCRTRNQTCRDCHEHRESEMDDEHDDVEGYEWESLKCVGCHSPR